MKASCGMLMIFKEFNSFDWCCSCLLHSMMSKTWRVSRSFKGYCNSPAYVVCKRVCVCVSVSVCVCVCVSNSPTSQRLCEFPFCLPLCVFTCNSCCWICCSWKRQSAHQSPLPERNRSVSLRRSRPGERQNKHTCVKRQTKGTGEEKTIIRDNCRKLIQRQ